MRLSLDDMDYQLFFNISAGIAFTLAGWIIRSIFEAVNTLKTDMVQLEREIHAKYLQKDDYRVDMRDIKEMLSNIYNKLDNKQDK